MLSPWAAGGSVKFNELPETNGKEYLTTSLIIGRTTSASTRKVAVSDQVMADTWIVRPGCSSSAVSILVKGHGPAIHEARALRNSFPAPASSAIAPREAFHLLSGEQRGAPLHDTLPIFTTSNGRTALPTFSSVALLIEYLTTACAMVCVAVVSAATGVRAIGSSFATVMLREIGTYRFRAW